MSNIVVNLADNSITDAENAVIVNYPMDADTEEENVVFYAAEHGVPVSPTQSLRDFVEQEIAAVTPQYGAPDVYYNIEHDCAVLVTDRRLVEIYRNPDRLDDPEATMYVADYIETRRP